jgi:hypothetical protein
MGGVCSLNNISHQYVYKYQETGGEIKRSEEIGELKEGRREVPALQLRLKATFRI